MTVRLFDRPLFVRRARFIQEIAGLDDLFDFLVDWPEDRQDLAYETMLRACRDAAAGRFPLEALRDNFERFLKRHDMISDVEHVPVHWQRVEDRNIGDH